MKTILNVVILAAIVALCVIAHECPAGDCRGVLQLQQVQTYAAPAQVVFQPVQQVQAYAVAQPQFVVQRQVQPVYVQQVQRVQRVQVVQRQRQQVVVQRVVQPQRVIVRERVIDNGGRRNVQVGLFNFGR